MTNPSAPSACSDCGCIGPHFCTGGQTQAKGWVGKEIIEPQQVHSKITNKLTPEMAGTEHTAPSAEECQHDFQKTEIPKIEQCSKCSAVRTARWNVGEASGEEMQKVYEYIDNHFFDRSAMVKVKTYISTLEKETQRWRNAVEDARNTAADIWEDKMLPNHDNYEDVAADYKARCVKLQDRMNEILTSIPLRP